MRLKGGVDHPRGAITPSADRQIAVGLGTGRLPVAGQEHAWVGHQFAVRFHQPCRSKILDQTPITVGRRGAPRQPGHAVVQRAAIKIFRARQAHRERPIGLRGVYTGVRERAIFTLKGRDRVCSGGHESVTLYVLGAGGGGTTPNFNPSPCRTTFWGVRGGVRGEETVAIRELRSGGV